MLQINLGCGNRRKIRFSYRRSVAAGAAITAGGGDAPP
jgi:hypothetical protein